MVQNDGLSKEFYFKEKSSEPNFKQATVEYKVDTQFVIVDKSKLIITKSSTKTSIITIEVKVWWMNMEELTMVHKSMIK